jgi:hypothetical protein
MTAENNERKKCPIYCTTCKSWYYCIAADFWPVSGSDKHCKNWEIADEDELTRRKEKPLQ